MLMYVKQESGTARFTVESKGQHMEGFFEQPPKPDLLVTLVSESHEGVGFREANVDSETRALEPLRRKL